MDIDIVEKAKELGFELFHFDVLGKAPDAVSFLKVNKKIDRFKESYSNKVIGVKENLEYNYKRFLIASQIIYYLEHKDEDVIENMIYRR